MTSGADKVTCAACDLSCHMDLMIPQRGAAGQPDVMICNDTDCWRQWNRRSSPEYQRFLTALHGGKE